MIGMDKLAGAAMSKLPGAGEVLEGMRNADKSPAVKTALAFAGKPIFYDLNKDFTPKKKEKKEEPNFLSKAFRFLNRYIVTWGNAIGIGSFAANLFLSFTGKKNEEGTKGIGYQFLGTVTQLLGIIGIGASTWANIKKIPVDHYVGAEKRLAALGLNIIDDVGESLDDKEKTKILTKHKDTPLRFNAEEQQEIDLRINFPHEPTKIFFTGAPGTGKTEGMNLICKSIIEYEKAQAKKENRKEKEVTILRLSGKKITERILGIQGNENAFSQASSMLGFDLANEFKHKPAELLLAVFTGLQEKYKEYETQGKRLIVELDEVDFLWSLARKEGIVDPEYAEKLSSALAELLDKNTNHDILLASNESVQDLVGLKTEFKNNEDKLNASYMGRTYRRLHQISVEVKRPIRKTKACIAAVYLKKLSSEDRNHLDATLKNFVQNETEQNLTLKLEGEIEKYFKKENLGEITDINKLKAIANKLLLEKRFQKAVGSTIEDTIKDLIKDCKTTKNKLTIQKIIEKIIDKAHKLTTKDHDKVKKYLTKHANRIRTCSAKESKRKKEIEEFEREHGPLLTSLLGMSLDKLKNILKNDMTKAHISELLKIRHPQTDDLRIKVFDAISDPA